MKRYILLLNICFLFVSYSNAQCIEDTHSSFKSQSWLSCNEKESPIAGREEGHWLSLDLAFEYQIDSLWIWNYNVWGETGNGVKELVVDYSSDGVIWSTLGPFTIDKAPGSWKYNSPTLLNLGNISARYIVMTVLQTWDPLATCAGIGELKFSVEYSTSLEDVLAMQEFKISPNPASSIIRIESDFEFGDCKILIYNALGQLVKELNEQSVGLLELDIIDLEDGLYFINLQSRNGMLTQSFVKTSG